MRGCWIVFVLKIFDVGAAEVGCVAAIAIIEVVCNLTHFWHVIYNEDLSIGVRCEKDSAVT